MKKKYLCAAMILVLAAGDTLTGCSTSAGDFAEEYFAGLSDIFPSGSSSQTTADASDTASEKEAESTTSIDTPEEFTVTNEGEYTFSTVEGAAQYYIYLCDTSATEDTDDYLYACQVEAQEGQDTITGEFPFEYKYGEYLAKLFAVADDNTFSAANVIDYEHSGEITVPRVAYSWDGAGNMTFDVVNVNAYEYSVYPDVEVTVTSLDSGDETTVTIENISESAYLTTELDEGQYTIEAKGVTDSELVTNPTTDSYTVAESLALGSEASQSSDYEIRATYTAVSMFLIDFTTQFDTNASDISYTWANVLTAEFNRDTSKEDDWTQYYFVGEGTGDDGLHAEIAFKADGTCRMIARGGPYGGNMGGERIAETGPDGYEWVEANGTWSIDEAGVITFTVS